MIQQPSSTSEFIESLFTNDHMSLTKDGIIFFVNEIGNRISDADSDVPFLYNENAITTWITTHLYSDDINHAYQLYTDTLPKNLFNDMYERGKEGAVDYLYHQYLRNCIFDIVSENRKTFYSFDFDEFIG